ncbi:hypothetical protein [Murimonas intestini]
MGFKYNSKWYHKCTAEHT